MPPKGPLSPEEYVRNACELHLQVPLGPSASEALEKFLSTESPADRLFLWVPTDGDPQNDGARASTESLEGRNLGAVAFLNSSPSGSPIETASQLHCMTLAPRIYVDEEKKDDGDTTASTSTEGGQVEAAPGRDTYLSLQLYARHCFVPAVRAVRAAVEGEGDNDATTGNTGTATNDSSNQHQRRNHNDAALEDKIRELDVALGQSLRSSLGQVPRVVLATHPLVRSVDVSASAKMDLAELGLEQVLGDDSVLNELQGGCSGWISDIRKVTVLPTTTPFPPQGVGADLEELSFWEELDASLRHVRRELDRDDVRLTLHVLRTAKRFLATIALQNNAGLEAAEKHCGDVLNYLKHYPAQSLVAARDLGKVLSAMDDVFDHLPKVRASQYYPLDRVASLLTATTHTLRSRVEAILVEAHGSNGMVLSLTYKDYLSQVREPTQRLFESFDLRFQEFSTFYMELGRRGRKTTTTAPTATAAQTIANMELAHRPLVERLDRIHEFWTAHHKLSTVVAEVGLADEVLREVEEAPTQMFATVELLDLSEKGVGKFMAALDGYDRKIDGIEQRLATMLRDRLTVAEDAEEMFRVFARFHPLLSRVRVQNAVKDYQAQLIQTVTSSIQRLQTKFTEKYESSPSHALAQLRGIPPVAGKILWAGQMERQVQFLMKQMSHVLGTDWGRMLEGRALARAGDELVAKLDARAYFRGWVADWDAELKASTSSSGGTARWESYPILVERTPSGERMAVVNFSHRTEALGREVRFLRWLGYGDEIPRTLISLAQESAARHPHAVVLRTCLRAYTSTTAQLDADDPTAAALVAPQRRAVRDSIGEAFGTSAQGRRIRWSDPGLGEWVGTLSELVCQFEERVETLRVARERIAVSLRSLEVVPYASASLEKPVADVQAVVDELSLSSYVDMEPWVASVDARMGEILGARLEGALLDWIDALKEEDPDSDGDEEKKAEDNDDKEKPKRTRTAVDLPEILVEIVLKNQEISASPQVPVVRTLFLEALHRYMGICCQLTRPSSGRFEVFGEAAADVAAAASGKSDRSRLDEDRVFGTWLVDNGVTPTTLAEAYRAVEVHMASVQSSVRQWLAYQCLWDTRPQDVAGDSLDGWRTLLTEARDARGALDAGATRSRHGPVVLRYDKVQSQIHLKYDAWQRELRSGTASRLGERITQVHDDLIHAKSRLEAVILDSGTMSMPDLVAGVTYLQEMVDKKEELTTEVDNLVACERLLKQERHSFPEDWIQASRAVGVHGSLEQILTKRRATLEEQTPALRQRVTVEDRKLRQSIITFLETWESDKPLRGQLTPLEATDVLANFEVTLVRQTEAYKGLQKAKTALQITDDITVDEAEDGLKRIQEELSDLKEVWTCMQEPHRKLEEWKETPWNTCVPRKVRQGLESILADLRALPNRVRQYDAYTTFQENVQKLVSGHAILNDLKTDALKDRHWKVILKELGLRNLPMSELTVGALWAGGVIARKAKMQEILSVAQGEMAIEVFLQEVRDRWMKEELDLVLYQNRVRLLRGWDQLFTGLDDHAAGLVLMKSSAAVRSVREFQEEGRLWEDRLTKLRAIFEAWIDVQRRWVYLEGIFFGSADIKNQLPTEWSRFKNVDTEFVGLMRRISQRPNAIEALNMGENLQRTLERLGNLMSVIQKALGEYLELQRADFSRFYFLGDDDLLEIIGNSAEPLKVLPHVGKMFAGLGNARYRDSEGKEDVLATFDAMLSKDGETVELDRPVVATKKKAVKSWLRELDEGMKRTLAKLLLDAIREDVVWEEQDGGVAEDTAKKFVDWAVKFPGQIMILASLITWSTGVDTALKDEEHATDKLQVELNRIRLKLKVMAQTVLQPLPHESRKKFEQLITELVHQRDVTVELINGKVTSITDFRWLYQLRFYFDPKVENLVEQLRISLSNASFFYGFEYLGIGNRLVQTPLTDRCYLTLTQALHFRLGGNPYGPAGTGKTESVKALGAQLGRFVVVMNCDETFDFGAMGRLFCGLCQVGAWGCFDEFNRLEERILSAVSQQILTIQRGLIERQSNIELLGRSIRLHKNVGIFVTMNPGYAGRSNLPDNLKTLFRGVAMVVPDKKLIAEVIFYSQGIVNAQVLAGKIVDLFENCKTYMSKQSHYDYGLRALKTLLVSAGGLKREALQQGGPMEGDDLYRVEEKVLIQGSCNNIIPKLVKEDIELFSTYLRESFPGAEVAKMEDAKLREVLVSICAKEHYVMAESWVQKIMQLKQVLDMRHGVMLVGPPASGKSSALNVLMKGLEALDSIKGNVHVIDAKAFDKDALYGVLDGTTMEWTDGVFTSLLRTIIANQRGESEQRHWIIFDGDVDPEWAENLNSVLDDNKLLTLPSGERLTIPSNLRIILEVDSLAQATPATVSRCGMVWFSEDEVTAHMCLKHMIDSLEKMDIVGNESNGEDLPLAQNSFLENIKPLVISEREDSNSLVADALEVALEESHVMDPSRGRLLTSLQSLLLRGIRLAIEYDENHPDFPMSGEHMTNFSTRWLLHSLLWSFSGSCSWDVREKFGKMILSRSGMSVPPGGNLTDFRVRPEDGEYELWSNSVPRMEIESHKVTATDVVITTTDTLRHSEVLGSWISSRMPLILCGPPGSGKTMTLTSVLTSLENVFLASLNFSSGTTPELILKTFSQHCSYVRRGKHIYLEPAESVGAQTWLIIFCDEINLPQNDSYGTQKVIMFMRQLIEQGGFWRHDNVWIKLNRVQFVGACNPPTDAGRVEMSHRFMRHAPLLLVDFPARDSLMQIYGTFNGGMMKLFPSLRADTQPMTSAMVDVFTACKQKFTPEMQPQYFYSPRELSRWVRGIYEAVVNMDQGLRREELVRIWAHEALRLFCDRLVEESEREWTENMIDDVAKKNFGGVDFNEALGRPMFYSSWLSKETRGVTREELKEFLSARLKVFYEEELDVPLVVFDEVLDHILRIDRVLRQPMGHCLLVGDSGAGKTVLSKFVSWMNGLTIFQIKAHSRYGMSEFNEDLRSVMRRVGVDGEKICFIFDEGNALGSGFLEAMNALLASGEVPGLFEGDDYASLMTSCRDSAARDGVIVESEEELWRRFTKIVQRNLHVVFTMNPSGGEWKNRSTTSPALFNRCVVDWFGTWSIKAMGEVGREFTNTIDMGDAEAVGGAWGVGEGEPLMEQVAEVFEGVPKNGLRQAVVASLIELHKITNDTAEESAAASPNSSRTFLSPRDYLALIQNFVSCFNNRRSAVEDEQLHVNAGLTKLRQTQENVAEMKVALGTKGKELREKEFLANNKLQQMVEDQKIAEKRKEEAEKMSIAVEKQQSQIDSRKAEAQKELDEAEPALIKAQQSVKGIRKKDLDEIRRLGRPPEMIKLTLEMLAIMLGEKKIDWAGIRKLISDNQFIPSILNFDVDKLTSRQIKQVQEKYIDGNAGLNEESVNRSSKACGPLYVWVVSQIKYSTVYNNVQPLREEVERLEKDAKKAKDESERLTTEVNGLEKSISQYKADYAVLIRDVTSLKAEMESVSTKVGRAESLINSLSRESERWSNSVEGFQSILRNLVGDALLMAAFLTYAGFFDFKSRQSLSSKWRKVLDVLGIEFREDLSIVESLSTASERFQWETMGLQSDSLSMENGVILNKCVRFPLVIDPSGQAIEYLKKKFKDDKIQCTSFLDKAFMKTLAGSVRFGTTLLIENVERIDPVLNPILNKEIQRTGGRSLVRIGTEDVDFSPNFRVILSTKDIAAKFTPDLCSRVTLVNFTITPASLQSQARSIILTGEKPDVEEKRIDLLKLQGEQNVKMRELEDQMLSTISAVEGSILDDDRVVTGMEVLMKEGETIVEQIAKSSEVMAEVQQTILKFESLSEICRKLFVLLGELRNVNFLYEFSAYSFMKVIECVLECTEREDSESDEGRLQKLQSNLFVEVASRIGRGLLEEDKYMFAILLAKIIDENIMEKFANSTLDDLSGAIESAFGPSFPWQGRGLSNLKQITEKEIDATIPLMLVSAPGHDVSGRVEAMAREDNKELSAVAMGSNEGFALAEGFVNTASKRGTWVMLKNCHLCVDWLRENLVKKLQSLGAGAHPDFRIFITSEINPKLPASLLRLSDIVIAEAPSGMKATMSRFFLNISPDRFSIPVRNRLYLLLAWLHAVVQERLRFVPVGWTIKYEFTEADASHGLDVFDALLEEHTKGKHHVAPEKLPWDAIRSTLCRSVYGAKLTSDTDQKVLDDLVNSLFTPRCYDVDFELIAGVEDSPSLPEGNTREDCVKWISALPFSSPPTWVGLDGSAEVERSKMIAHSVLDKVKKIEVS